MTRWFRLEYLSGCRIEGADAFEFCQSQFTADVDSLTEQRWQQLAWCSRKGRVRFLSIAKRNQDHVELVFPAVQAGLLKELALFTIGRKVDIGPVQAMAGAWTGGQDTYVGEDRFGRVLRLLSESEDDPGAPDRESLERWLLQDKLAPLPWLDDRTQDRFLPQALGLENNGGLSYTKGCYPGQEIVARVHYLGRAPERLTALRVESSEPLTSRGLTRADATTSDGQRVTLLSVARQDDHLIGLAVVPDKAGSSDTIEFELDGSRLQAKMTPVGSL